MALPEYLYLFGIFTIVRIFLIAYINSLSLLYCSTNEIATVLKQSNFIKFEPKVKPNIEHNVNIVYPGTKKTSPTICNYVL